MARAWAELMDRLGYTRYVAQGGDVGAAVTDAMGRQAPEGCSASTSTCSWRRSLSGNNCRRNPSRNARRPRRSRRSRRAASATSSSWHAAADDRLRPAGFTRRAGGLVARPRHGQLLQDLPRVRRRRARGQSHPGQHRRQHHAVLADGHRRLGRPVVLGGRTGPGRSACGRPGSSGGLGSGRLHDVPRRDLAAPRSWVETVYPTSPTSTRSTGAATSPPGRSRSSSPRRCGLHSAHCANDTTVFGSLPEEVRCR